jgi:lipopolysaccharide transport system ATP-binding protein
MKPIVRVEELSKEYRIGARRAGYNTLRDSIVRAVQAPLESLRRQNGKPDSETIWAVKDVTFEVEPGEVVGIIGRNGAGKSTLLKMLSRITEPTSGRAELYGRIASLLEVGTGFHSELTGRENTYLNGAILGMRKAEIDRKFDEIVAFAELEKFLDTPVKHYSSGMYMRLAFAVASHLEPEILIVDEVLAVGDAAFQKKCLGKMDEVAKQGRTVLFVSHNLTAVKSLSHRVLRLDNGQIVDVGRPADVVSRYTQFGSETRLEHHWDDPLSAPGGSQARLHHISITPLEQDAGQSITVDHALQLDAAFWNYSPGAVLNFSVVLYNLEGVAVFNTGSVAQSFSEGLVWGRFVIPANFLNDDSYSIRVLIVKDTSVILLDVSDALMFEVQDSERKGNWYGKWVGVVRPSFDWQLRTEKQPLLTLPSKSSLTDAN